MTSLVKAMMSHILIGHVLVNLECLFIDERFCSLFQHKQVSQDQC